MLKPEHIVITIDTREQTPLSFDIGDISIPTMSATLKTGDYSALHFQDEICIERKSLPDLLGCIGKSRERFEAELMRMQAYPTRALVIESSGAEIEAGIYKRSKVHPNAVIGSLLSWQERFQIPIMMCDNRERAGRFVARFIFSAIKRRVAKYQPILSNAFKD